MLRSGSRLFERLHAVEYRLHPREVIDPFTNAWQQEDANRLELPAQRG
jgi:hypothetical protein